MYIYILNIYILNECDTSYYNIYTYTIYNFLMRLWVALFAIMYLMIGIEGVHVNNGTPLEFRSIQCCIKSETLSRPISNSL